MNNSRNTQTGVDVKKKQNSVRYEDDEWVGRVSEKGK